MECPKTIKTKKNRGGKDKVVEIDESKFGRRKYHRGHRVKGQWVFGGYERGTGRIFMVPVEKSIMEKKYGVSLSQLKQLKEFQLSLLRNRKKTLPAVMNVIGSITTTIQNNVENHLVKQQFIARLSVGNGIILIEPTEGHTISPKLRDIVCVNVIGNDVIIEFRPYLFFDKCTFHLDETQRQNFLASLPPIYRPDDGHVDTDNSSEGSDLNDSVAGRTQLGITTSDREGSDEGR